MKSVQEKLEHEQQAVISSLRQLHNEEGAASQAITAVISTTIKDPPINVSTSIILVSGIVKGQNQVYIKSREKKKGKILSNIAGSILSFTWIHNSELKRLIEDKWPSSVCGWNTRGFTRYASVDDYQKSWEILKRPQQLKPKEKGGASMFGVKGDGIKFESTEQMPLVIKSAANGWVEIHHNILNFADMVRFKAFQV